MNPKPSLARLVWFSLVVMALLGLGAWYASRTVPPWYVSPPLDAQGRRAKVRVPYGWKLDTQASHLPNGLLGPSERVTIVFESQESLLSRGFRWLFKRPEQNPSKLYVDVGRGLELIGMNSTAPADGTEDIMWMGQDYLAYRIIKVGKPPMYGVVAFSSPDKPIFDNTHASINNSFRIE